MNFLNTIRRDLYRSVLPVLICIVLLALAVWLPRAVSIPELAPALFFGALTFTGITLAHVARRVLFPKVDLHELFLIAAETPTGAGLCVLGLCVILATLINTFATIFAK